MARGYANVTFEWNKKHSALIKDLGFGKELQRDAAEILYKNAFEYMPYVSGDLAINVHIQAFETKANIVHQVKYANKQYYGKGYNRYKLIHENADSEWYDVAWVHKKKQITKEIDEARLKYRRT